MPEPPVLARVWAALACGALVVAANLLALTGIRVPFIGAAVGFWFILVYPVYLLFTTSAWQSAPAAERLGCCLAAVLLLLMLAGLGANTVLPWLGVRHPLGPVPVTVLVNALDAALCLARQRWPGNPRRRLRLAGVTPAEARLLTGSAAAVLLTVAGANRLNNGAGDLVSLLALTVLLAVLVLALCWRRQVRDATACAVLYLVSLALLLMTSLRGWYVAGHDIQTEYRVFQLTSVHAHWDIADFRDAYNACLSITILPTELSRVIGVSEPYIYKVFFQLIFAACPVLVFVIARRHWARPAAFLAAVYFIGFPTFFTDMPFMNRQEIAYLFVCAAVLLLTRTGWSPRRRQASLAAAAVGIEVSHYSTMYLFLVTLVVAWAAQHAAVAGRRLLPLLRRQLLSQFRRQLLSRRRPLPVRHRRAAGRRAAAGRSSWAVICPAVSFGAILLVAGIVVAWSDLATGTGGTAVADARLVITALLGQQSGAQSSDVSYGIVPGRPPSPQAVLNGYRRSAFQARASSPPGTYAPSAALAQYRTRVVNGAPAQPLTTAGHVIAALGVPVAGLNGLIRQAAAKGEQVFLVIGLIAIAGTRRWRQRVSYEYFLLCLGATVMVALVTILPGLSADYGVLRAFQEALILIAPVIVTGSLALFSGLARGRRLARARAPAAAAAAVSLGVFASTTGLLPQLTGGYPAQLNLSNSGQYYDIYYPHPQEEAAVGWLAGQPGVLPDGVQAESLTEQFYFTAPSMVTGRQFVTDFYPPLIRRASWVILGYRTTRTGQATAFYDGDLVTYAYPVNVLGESKNLVYDNGGSEIYR